MQKIYRMHFHHVVRGIIETVEYVNKEDVPDSLDYVRFQDDFYKVLAYRTMLDLDKDYENYIIIIRDFIKEDKNDIGDPFMYVTDIIDEDDVDMIEELPREVFLKAHDIFKGK